MKRIAVTVVVAGTLVAGCTDTYHIDPVTEGYTGGSKTDLSATYFNPIDNLPTIPPFNLAKDCLPGLGGVRNSDGTLDCKQSAVEAIMLIAAGEAKGSTSIKLFKKSATEGEDNNNFQSRIARNRLQDYLFASSTEVCDIYKTRIYTSIAQTNTVLDLATLGLSSAATIVTGMETTRLLSGLATAVAGGRASINDNFVQGQLASALISAIDTSRKDLRTSLAGKRSQGLDDYFIEEAVFDVAKYHELCSIYAALAALNDKAGDPIQNLETQLNRARKLLAFKQDVAGKDADASKAAGDEATAIIKDSGAAPDAN